MRYKTKSEDERIGEKMKKFFCFALAIMMLFAFAACSNSSDSPAANGGNEVLPTAISTAK